MSSAFFALAGTKATRRWSPAAFRPPSAADSGDATQTLPKRCIATKRHGQDPRRDAAARLVLFPRLYVSFQSILSRAGGPEGVRYAALVSESQSANTRPAVCRPPGQPEGGVGEEGFLGSRRTTLPDHLSST